MTLDARAPDDGSEDGGVSHEARSLVALLGDRPIRTYFLARLAASIGTWTHNIVSAILVYELTGSALTVGLVSIAQFGPQFLLTPYMGALADRGSRKRQAGIGYGIAGLGTGYLAAVFGIQGTIGGHEPVLAAALVVGIGFTIGAPAAQALIPSLAPPWELSRVVALATIPMTIARTIGPGLGVFLLVTGGPAIAYGVAACSQFVLSVTFQRLQLRPVPRRMVMTDGSVRAGIRYLRRDARAKRLLFGVAAVGFGIDPLITLSPALAKGMGGDEMDVAAIASAFGVGAGSYFFVFGKMLRIVGNSKLASLGMWTMAAGSLGLALSRSPGVAIGSSLVVGLGMMAATTSLTSQLQERLSEDMRGRVMALWLVAFVGSRPLAAATNGFIADVSSPSVAIAVVAALLCAVGAVVSPERPEPRDSGQPDKSD